MSWLRLHILTLLGVVLSRPSGNETEYSTKPLSPEDYEFLRRHTPTHRIEYPAGFQFLYVNHQGQIVENNRPATGHWVEVTGSPQTQRDSLYVVALEVGKMLHYAPSHIFNNLANHTGCGVGVFTEAEKLTVYPEYANLKDTAACYGRCDGLCSQTCTADGRKWDTVAGAGGTKAVVLIDNVLCTARDPYAHRDNILIQVFAHVVERIGMSDSERAQTLAAYDNAHNQGLWRPDSYAMANHQEYFAEGTGVFFYVNFQSTSGGMINCGSSNCGSEAQARQNIRDHDPQLFNVLSNVYTSGRPDQPSGLRVCERAVSGR